MSLGRAYFRFDQNETETTGKIHEEIKVCEVGTCNKSLELSHNV